MVRTVKSSIIDKYNYTVLLDNLNKKYFKMDMSTIRIFYILTNMIKMYSLAILMKNVLKENEMPEVWVL